MAEKLDPGEWVQHLPNIPVGGRKRLPHGCGEGRPLVVFHADPRSSAYCHRCGALGHHERVMSLEERLALQQKQLSADAAARGSIELPAVSHQDAADWPQALKVWVYRMGLGPAHLAALGAYYNADMDRMVLPIRDAAGRVVYWTARHAHRSPKWIGPDVAKRGLVAKFGAGRGDSIVLVEDVLSAYKVGIVCEAWGLFGTKLGDSVLLQLLNDPRPVVTWLDDDRGRPGGSNPGQEAASKIAQRLRALGKAVCNATSERDPKYLARSKIEEVLRCAS